MLLFVRVFYPSNRTKLSTSQGQSIYKCQGLRMHFCSSQPRVPHWSGCGSGAWRGPRHWRRPCCSLHVHTHMASPLCGTAGVSSGSPGESRPLSSLRTGKRWTGQRGHSRCTSGSWTQGLAWPPPLPWHTFPLVHPKARVLLTTVTLSSTKILKGLQYKIIAQTYQIPWWESFRVKFRSMHVCVYVCVIFT